MKKDLLIPKPRTSFVQVECGSCGNRQVVFSAPSKKVKCLACEKNLLNLTGSKATFEAKVLKAVDSASGHRFSLKRIDRRKEKAAERKAFKERQEAVELKKSEEAKESEDRGKELAEESGERGKKLAGDAKESEEKGNALAEEESQEN